MAQQLIELHGGTLYNKNQHMKNEKTRDRMCETILQLITYKTTDSETTMSRMIATRVC